VKRAALLLLGAIAASCGGDLEFQIEDPWPQPALLPPVTGPRLAFTNSGDDTISFVDLATLAPIAKVPVGIFPIEREGPHHLVASDDGRHLFVGISNTVPLSASGPHGSHGTGTADGYLLKVDAITGREIARARVSKSPGDVRFDPSKANVWQSHFNYAQAVATASSGGQLADLDSYLVATSPETMERKAEVRICSGGHGIGFSPDGSTIYVSCSLSDELAVVNAADHAVTRVPIAPNPGFPPLPVYYPYALTVSPSNGRVWVSAQQGPRGLYVYDPATRSMIDGAKIATDGAPVFGDFLSDGSRFYVVTQHPDRLLEIDPATSMVLRDLDLEPAGCVNAHLVTLSPDERSLWIVCEGDQVRTPGTLEVLARDTFEESAEVKLGLYPDDLTICPMPEGM
jgi:YVTN family beta-propeller protein